MVKITNTQVIPQASKEQMVEIEKSFIRSYGRSFNRMKKADLALMIANQSTNYKTIEAQAQKISILGLTMKRQRDVFHKMLRKRDGK